MLIRADFRCAEVPAPIEYAALRPDDDNDDALPLLYVLHGGGGSREYLDRVRPAIERAWAEKCLPPLVAVTPSVHERSFYMNFRDGSERWEDALVGSFMAHIRNAHGAGGGERRLAMTCGPSMGGVGSLRLAFKHPDAFGAVAALAPGIEPVVDYAEIQPEQRYRLFPELLDRAFGSPLDTAYWRVNHPTAIAHDDPARLRESGLAIYLECGDQDSFELHRGAELLHRILFDAGISHEYRLVRGADHVGATFPGRFRDALAFLAKVIEPPPPDPAVAELRARIARLRR